MKTCRMCGLKKPLIKAHLLPDSLKKIAENFKAPGAHMVAASLVAPEHEKIQTLEFDKDILCASCDGALGEFDQVFIEFLKDWHDAPIRSQTIDPNRPAPVYKRACNTEKLKLAFAGIMFRFAISSRYGGAKIGPIYEKTFSDWLKAGRISGKYANNFKVWLFGTSKAPKGLSEFFMPGPIGDRFYFTLELYGLIAFILVGGHKTIPSLSKYREVCSSANLLQFQIVPFEGSPLADRLKEIWVQTRTQRV